MPGLPLTSLRLLVVDDEAQILHLLEQSLSEQGFKVWTAPSGPAALELARRQTFDVVVMDTLMTPWDGFETVNQLCKLLGERTPAVVFLMSPSDPGCLDNCPEGVRSVYLTRPFRMVQLVETVRMIAAP